MRVTETEVSPLSNAFRPIAIIYRHRGAERVSIISHGAYKYGGKDNNIVIIKIKSLLTFIFQKEKSHPLSHTHTRKQTLAILNQTREINEPLALVYVLVEQKKTYVAAYRCSNLQQREEVGLHFILRGYDSVLKREIPVYIQPE